MRLEDGVGVHDATRVRPNRLVGKVGESDVGVYIAGGNRADGVGVVKCGSSSMKSYKASSTKCRLSA